MTLANRLRTLMRLRGIRSQRQLARLSGVPQTSIHRIIVRCDGYAPSLRTIGRLARALGTSTLWLSEGESPSFAYPAASRQTAGAAAPGVGEPDGREAYIEQWDGNAAEIQRLLRQLSHAEKRHVLALVRLLANRPTEAAGAAPRSSP